MKKYMMPNETEYEYDTRLQSRCLHAVLNPLRTTLTQVASMSLLTIGQLSGLRKRDVCFANVLDRHLERNVRERKGVDSNVNRKR